MKLVKIVDINDMPHLMDVQLVRYVLSADCKIQIHFKEDYIEICFKDNQTRDEIVCKIHNWSM